ncbi:acetolactate decarboxylase [Chloroflexota bacterium]
MKYYLYISTILICLLISITAGCAKATTPSEYAPNLTAQREILVQISTVDAILNGVYDGVVDFGTLKKYGDFGIGTFEGLDGEMVGFDGNFFQIRADGIAYPVSDSMETPFAAVTFFEVDYEETIPAAFDYDQTQKLFDNTLPTENIFYAIKIQGTFSHMKTRSVPGQQKPYPPLFEVTKNQPVFEFANIDGTLVGFRCPVYVAGINVPGYHLHFLAKGNNTGGHVLEFKVTEAVVLIDYTSKFLMVLPDEESGFYELDLTQDKQLELEEAER